MAILKEIVAIVGKYTDREGKEKNQYQNMGKIIETAKGSHMIKIDVVPVGWDGWAYINDVRPKDEQRSVREKDLPEADGGDIPF